MSRHKRTDSFQFNQSPVQGGTCTNTGLCPHGLLERGWMAQPCPHSAHNGTSSSSLFSMRCACRVSPPQPPPSTPTRVSTHRDPSSPSGGSPCPVSPALCPHHAPAQPLQDPTGKFHPPPSGVFNNSQFLLVPSSFLKSTQASTRGAWPPFLGQDNGDRSYSPPRGGCGHW